MKEHGFTLIEMISVLLIIGIISGVAISRVVGLDEMELASRVNSIRDHIRFTQIMAMKRNDMIWGIKSDGTNYWVFKTATPEVAAEPDDTNNQVYLPGNENKKIEMPEMNAFPALYFDKFGIPYAYDTGTGAIVPRTSDLTILIGAKRLTVTEETGFVE